MKLRPPTPAGAMLTGNTARCPACHKPGALDAFFSSPDIETALCASCKLSVEEIILPLGCKSFEVDSRSVVIPSTGGRIMCHRPRLDKWACSFTLDVDEEMFSANFVRQLVDDAGRKIGLGDFRPARKGPFGKFRVVNWRVI